jgi:hypothetical protein
VASDPKVLTVKEVSKPAASPPVHGLPRLINEGRIPAFRIGSTLNLAIFDGHDKCAGWLNNSLASRELDIDPQTRRRPKR